VALPAFARHMPLLAVQQSVERQAPAQSSASLAFLRVIRLVRIFKLTKHSVGLQVLLLTFRASLEGLARDLRRRWKLADAYSYRKWRS